ncbi:hypothetical protein GWI33_015271 [Rhynchophorus ferrugineus]|uniref:Uncharacterized protein n=1 Tax=Rhynchophorus ferrugineus TaxID=354439 RepID=A0A834M9X2_RHYFE|nr:hypothetical protein GWI33_015271 [Rhynchophorus ferrugineus]
MSELTCCDEGESEACRSLKYGQNICGRHFNRSAPSSLQSETHSNMKVPRPGQSAIVEQLGIISRDRTMGLFISDFVGTTVCEDPCVTCFPPPHPPAPGPLDPYVLRR